VKATAWKHTKKDNNFTYIIQVDGIKGVRNKNKILKELKDWKEYGEGYDPATKTKTLMYKKQFSSEMKWKKWARGFPHYLIEIGEKSGKPKPYKLGLDYIESKNKRRRTQDGKPKASR